MTTKEIDIYIIFYGEMKFFDQAYWFLNQCVNSVKKLSDYPYRIHIVDNGSEKEVIEKIRQLMPGVDTDVHIIINENQRGYASVMNKVINTAMIGGSDPFISIHSDMRVTRGWLNTLVQEYNYCMNKYKKPVCLMPHYLHYELEDSNPYLCLRANFKSPNDMESMCRSYDIPYSRENKDLSGNGLIMNGLMSRSPYRGNEHMDKRHITDDGSNLMSFIAGKDFFNTVGLYDENFTGWGWEDNDMGVRALIKGCKVLQTHDVYIEHASGLTRGIGKDGNTGRTYDYFLEKWGKSMTDDLQSGKLWVDLHNRQN
jgi:GT2 family glycosyltransferase